MFISAIARLLRVNSGTPKVRPFLRADALHTHLKKHETQLASEAMRILEAHSAERVSVLVAKCRKGAYELSDLWHEFAKVEANSNEEKRERLTQRLNGLQNQLGTDDPSRLGQAARELERWNHLALREARRCSTSAAEALKRLTPEIVNKTRSVVMAC